MFNQSYQQLTFRQEIISINETYPCPRCHSGALEPFGLTETFKCSDCTRNFVSLCGGRLLYPANRLGLKIAPTFWWDGFRWHWAGTTATICGWLAIASLCLLPIVCVNLAIYFNVFGGRPQWCDSPAFDTVLSLLVLELIYLVFWDFHFYSKRKRR